MTPIDTAAIRKAALAAIADPVGDSDTFYQEVGPAQYITLLDALTAAEGENETLRLAICGGEDVPGYAASLPLEAIIRVSEENHSVHLSEIDRSLGLEASLATAKERIEALEMEARRLSSALVDASVRVGTPGEIVNASQRGQALADVRSICDAALLPPSHQPGSGDVSPDPIDEEFAREERRRRWIALTEDGAMFGLVSSEEAELARLDAEFKGSDPTP